MIFVATNPMLSQRYITICKKNKNTPVYLTPHQVNFLFSTKSILEWLTFLYNVRYNHSIYLTIPNSKDKLSCHLHHRKRDVKRRNIHPSYSIAEHLYPYYIFIENQAWYIEIDNIKTFVDKYYRSYLDQTFSTITIPMDNKAWLHKTNNHHHDTPLKYDEFPEKIITLYTYIKRLTLLFAYTINNKEL